MADVDAEAAIVAHETRVESKAQAKRFTVYKVQVNLNGTKWAVYRRYNDFYNLHQKVRRRAVWGLVRWRWCLQLSGQPGPGPCAVGRRARAAHAAVPEREAAAPAEAADRQQL